MNGVPLSMMAMMGFLMLIGMVVNNGILLVDTTNTMWQDMPLKIALLKAGLHFMKITALFYIGVCQPSIKDFFHDIKPFSCLETNIIPQFM